MLQGRLRSLGVNPLPDLSCTHYDLTSYLVDKFSFNGNLIERNHVAYPERSAEDANLIY